MIARRAPLHPLALALTLALAPAKLAGCAPPRLDPPAPPAAAAAPPAPSDAAPAPPAREAPSPAAAAAGPQPLDRALVHLDRLAAEDAWLVRGGGATAQAILLGGQCAQSQFYAEAVKLAAARHVALVTLQGDKPCTGAFRGWTFDVPALRARIERAFLAFGLGAPRDVLVIGYSQGASLAERLAAAAPETFTRFVLMAHPRAVAPEAFARARAVVTMAGTLDRQDLMVKSAAKLAAAGVRARYVPLPGAAHGLMGDDPEGTFEGVFAWLDDAPAAR